MRAATVRVSNSVRVWVRSLALQYTGRLVEHVVQALLVLIGAWIGLGSGLGLGLGLGLRLGLGLGLGLGLARVCV